MTVRAVVMRMPSPAVAMAVVTMTVPRVSSMAVNVVTVATPRVITSRRSANTTLLNYRQPSILRNKQQRSRYAQDHQVGHRIASRLFFGS